jgi:hypothetical protein
MLVETASINVCALVPHAIDIFRQKPLWEFMYEIDQLRLLTRKVLYVNKVQFRNIVVVFATGQLPSVIRVMHHQSNRPIMAENVIENKHARRHRCLISFSRIFARSARYPQHTKTARGRIF